MLNRIIGSVLLIFGVSVGAGMLALPVVTAHTGFLNATLLMFVVWFFMTLGAFWILEVNLWLPNGSNLISMAKKTLGPGGQIISWASYLLLLYCLLSAYIAGGGDVVFYLLNTLGFSATYAMSAMLFLLVFAMIVGFGIKTVDWVNRGLIFIKIMTLFLLILFVVPHVQKVYLTHIDMAYITLAIMPVITSFGYAIIVPNLRTYLKGDVRKLRLTLFIGSLIPLVIYLLWEFTILGALTLQGAHGLSKMAYSGHATSDLMEAIGDISHVALVHNVSHVFTSICVATSFLGVSLSLCHFLMDGLRINKTLKGHLLVYIIAYAPPLFMVLFFQNAFIIGLSYAGIFCIILLVLLPAMMVWQGRYIKQLASGYQVWGGKALLIFTLLLSIAVILFDVIVMHGKLTP